MTYVCPDCGKLLEEKKEMRTDEIHTRGIRNYYWCNNCKKEVKPEIK